MQENEFKGILKKHADRFVLEPKQDSFAAITRKRKGAKRKRAFLFYLSAAVLLIVAGFGWMQTLKMEDTALAANTNEPASVPASADVQQIDTLKDLPVDGKKEKAISENLKEGSVSSEKSDDSKLTNNIPQVTVLEKPKQKEPTSQRDLKPAGIPSKDKMKEVKAYSSAQTSVLPKPDKKQESLMKPGAEQKVETTTPLMSTDVPVITGEPPVKDVANNQPVQQSRISEKYNASEAAANKHSGSDSSSSALTTLVKLDSLVSVPPANEPKKKTIEHKWAVQVFFTPQLFNSVYSANSDADLSWMKDYLSNKEENDKARYSFYTGVMMERFISEKFSVSAGVAYQMIKFEEIKVVNTVPPVETLKLNTMAMLDEQGLIKQVDRNRFDISFSSLEFPLQFSYMLPLKKWGIKFSAGASYSYLFNTRSLVFDKEDSLNVAEINDASNERLQQHNIFVSGGVSCLYRLTNRWEIGAGPVYRQAVYSLYSDDYVIRQKPYFIGMDAIIRYRF